ncbi:MAG: SMC-Scp complex subunit ScpB [Deltaproteobacteria bacterium]|nr:SMC-Scp complex subunit ScpB [Deltaproteobacteria bacterium]
MERAQQKQLVEALIVAGGEPVSAARLAEIVPGLEASEVAGIVAELTREYEEQGRALEICEVAGGYQLRTSASVAPYLRALHRERALRLTRAALETLAVIAYRQPVTRAEVEHVRGVDAGPVLKSLVDRKLVRIAGHREVPGRPLVYATTKRFLEVFGLLKLDDLPTLREVEELLPPPESAAAVTPLDADTADAIESAPPPGELH